MRAVVSFKAIFVVFPLLTFGAGGAGAAEATSTQAIMDAIFAPMTEVLALSFKGDDFSDPANQAHVTEQLEKLATNIGRLETHAKSQDRAFEFVARSLGQDARRVVKFYKRGQFDEAQFIVHNMTENCIACHSSLPPSRTFPAAAQFLKRINVPALRPLERARLQVVTRQFDEALTSYEASFTDKHQGPGLLVTFGSISDYLKVAIGVKSDFKRPRAVFEALKARPTTPLHVRMQLDRWLAALAAFDAAKVLDDPQPLDRARKIMNDARATMDYPRDRDVLVQFVTADALLARYIHARSNDRGQALGEAYYLRGIAESLLEHSYWMSRSEFYFESAIRLAPAAAFAPKAYARLEESMLYSFSGSAGTNVPDESKELLDELKKIIHEAQASRI